MARDYRVNQRIASREVRVIDENGEQLGVLPLLRALQIARERELDLVEVAPNAEPPVCRLLDYDKFRYQQTKREREARKAHKPILVREVRFRTRIATHDRDSKVRQIRRFLEDGTKVKVTVMFRGREITHTDLGLQLLRNVAEEVKSQAKLEQPPIMETRNLYMVLAPLAQKTVKASPAAKGETEGAQAQAQAQDP
ncbi:MAG: translation initiation factor IF-3 [Chloroflexi bacterium]|nr:translation initiation factor IF-3 [Chloroflexota bacterium]